MFRRALAPIILVGGLAGVVALPALGQEKAPRAAAKGGKMFGIVTAKTDKDITVKAEGQQEPQVYRYASPSGGGTSAELKAALKMVFVSNLVVLQAKGEDEPVLTSIQAIHSKARSGVTSGTVVAVEPAGAGNNRNMPSLDVKPNVRGPTERYVTRWDPATKGWDKSLLQILAGLKVGDKVKIAWSYDERKRAVQIRVTGQAKPKPAKTEEKPDEAE
jgi:hypothetical protein